MSILALFMKDGYNASATFLVQIEFMSVNYILFLGQRQSECWRSSFSAKFNPCLPLDCLWSTIKLVAPVAQVDRALASGAGCERSSRSRGAFCDNRRLR